jgi:hypothetical protein
MRWLSDWRRWVDQRLKASSAASRPLARRRLFGGEPRFEPGRGLLDRPLQRAFECHIPPAAAMGAHRVGQRTGQDLPQPGGQLSRTLASKLVEGLMRLEQRLLHQVGRVKLAPQGLAELHSRQDAQVVQVAFQFACVMIRPVIAHRASALRTETARGRKLIADFWQSIFSVAPKDFRGEWQ